MNAILKLTTTKFADSETFFAVGDHHYSIIEIANAIVNFIGGTLRIMEWPKERKQIEIGDAIISNNKLKQMLEWSQEENLESGLLKTKAFYETCLQYYLR